MPFRYIRALAATVVVSSVILVFAGACAETTAPETWSMSGDGTPSTPVVGKLAVPEPAVRVTVNGSAREGASVSWSATAGTLGSTSSTTDANGRATVAWTLGTTAGAQTLTATGPAGTAPVQFTVTAAPDRPAIVTFAPDSVVLDAVGDSVELLPTITDQYQNATPVTPTFAVDSADVAGLTATRWVKSARNGRATVTATADTAHGAFVIVVKQVVASLDLSPAEPPPFASVGDTLTFVTVAKDRLGSAAPDAQPLYASSDTAVASVDTLGRLVTRKNGTAWVTVSVEGSTARDSVLVTVQQVPASIELTLAASTIAAGDSARVTAVVKDARGVVIPDAPVIFASSVDAIADVSSAGYVRAKKLGDVTITATSGTVATSVAASVIAGAAASIVLSPASDTLTAVGDTTTFSALVKDANGNIVGADIVWSSSSPAATVDSGGTVTAVENGSAWITASAGDARDSVQVTVQQAVSSIAISPDSLAVAVGDSAALAIAAADRGGAPVAGAAVAWTSRDTTIATVSAEGMVTVRGEGLVWVLATSESAVDSVPVRAYTTDAGCVETAHVVGDTATGAWTDNDCVTADNVPYDRYTMTFTSQAHFRATVDGPGGRKLLIRQGSATGSYIGLMPRAIADTTNPIAVDYLLAPGTYVLEVHAPAAGTQADYTLRTDTVSSISCAALTWATTNVEVSGDLATGDCLFNGGFEDYLVVNLPTGKRLKATLSATGFGPLIAIKDDHSLAAPVLSRQSRDVGGTVSTSWTTAYDDAPYNIIVGTYAAAETGTYTLRLDEIDATNTCVVDTVYAGTSTQAAWESTDCKDDNGQVYDSFQLAAAVSNGFRVNTVGSANRYLHVFVDGQHVGRHTTPDTATYVSQWFLRPGTVSFRVGAPDAGGTGAGYVVSTSADTNITNCRAVWAQRGAQIPIQALESTDCVYEGRYQDRLLVRLDSGTTFSPSMTATFGPRIVIRDANTAPDQVLTIAQDSVAGGLAATWTPTFTGVYEVIFTSYTPGATGNYSLSLPMSVGTIAVTPDSISLADGDTATASATVTDTQGNAWPGTVAWFSLDTMVARVSAAGTITAVAAGRTSIVASAEAASDTVEVTVTPSTAPVTAVNLAPDSANVVVGDTVRFDATMLSAQGDTITGRTVTWTSSDTTLARVDSLGLVTALAVGRPMIIAEREGASDTATVVITDAPVASVQLAPDTLRLTVADTGSLGATLRDSRDTVLNGRAIAWTSADTAIATVDTTGLVTARAVGGTWVTATSESVSDSAYVEVSPMPVASVVVTPDSTGAYVGLTLQLDAVTLGATGDTLTGRSIAWSSLSPGIATVDSTGVVTGAAPGLASIVATSEGKADTAKVLVRSPITRIVIAPDSTTLTSIGATQTLTAVAYDTADVAMTGVAFTWSVANPLVASLSSVTGENVTASAEGAGVTQVFASALGQTGSGVVRVGQFASTINTSPDTVYVTVGGRSTLTADVRDGNNAQIADARPIWRSNTSAFSIDSLTGTIAGSSLGAGHAWAELDGVTSDSVRVVVTSTAPPEIAFGSRTFAVGKNGSIQVPIYLSTAPTSTVRVRLTSSDTAKAKFNDTMLSFGPGVTQANATLYGQATGNVTLSAVDSAGVFAGDTVTAQVQITVALEFQRLTANGATMNVTDTFPGRLRLSDPAPAGGLYFTIDGKGYVEPSPATLYIPAGNLVAEFTIAGKTPSGTFTVTASANGVTAGAYSIGAVYAAALSFSNSNSPTGWTTRHVTLARGQELRPWVTGTGASLRTPAKVSSPVEFSVTSSDSSVAAVTPTAARFGADSNTYALGIRGVSVGTAVLTATAAGWTSAIDTVIVTSPRLKATAFWGSFGDTTNIYPASRAPNLSVTFTDSLGNGHPTVDSVRFYMRSSDTTVLKFSDTTAVILPGNFNVSVNGLLPVSVGGAWAYFEGPGLLPDSFHVTVRSPSITTNYYPPFASVGMRGAFTASVPGDRREDVWVRFTSTDTTIVAVDDSVRIPFTGTYANVYLSGRGYGTATIVASATGHTPDTLTVSTASGRVFVYSYPTRAFGNLADTLKIPAFGDRTISYTLQDSVRTPYSVEPDSAIVISFSIDDTTIATIDSAQVTYDRARGLHLPGSVRAVSGGMTWLRVTSPGILPDSFRILVEPAPLDARKGSSQYLAPFQHSAGGSYDAYVQIPNARTSPLTVYLTSLNPAVATMDADSVVVPAGQTGASIGWTAHTFGSDTVIFSAAGYQPDTIVLPVEQGRLRHYQGGGQRNSFYTTSSPTPRGFGFQTLSSSSNAPSTRTEVIRIVSTDPAVVTPDSEYIRVPAGVKDPSYTFTIVGPGTARFVITDSLGEYVGDTSAVVTVTAPPIYFANYGYSMGMQQQTVIVDGHPQEYLYLPDSVRGSPRVVYLASSDTTVATVPDSVIIPVGQSSAYYSITTHDTTGTIAITANSTGHLQGRFDLTVTRGTLELITASAVSVGANTGTLYVRLHDTLIGRSNAPSQDLVLTLQSSDPSVVAVDSATITIPAGVSDFSILNAWHGVNPGSATLTLKDERTGFVYYIEKSVDVTVSP